MKTILWFGLVLGALSASGKVFVTKQGQRVTLECGVSTYSTVLVWNRENDLLISIPKSQGKYNFPRKGKSDIVGRSNVRQGTKLEISPVKIQDAGKFTCEPDAKRFEHTLLVVSVSASPSGELQVGSEVTLQCQVSGLNPTDFTVQWKGPGGNPAAGSRAELKAVARSDAGTWNCMFSYDGVTHSESLEIKVQEPKTTAPSPTQPKDNPNPSCLDCGTPKPDTDLVLGLRWWMWIAIGVGCLVVLLLIVLIVVLRKRIKRRKRKFQKMKNGGLPMKPKKYCQCNRPAAAAKPQQGRRREKPSAPPLQPLLME